MFGLSLYTTERDLREVFSKFGPLSDVSIVYDQQSRRSRGFAFVYFETREDAKEVHFSSWIVFSCKIWLVKLQLSFVWISIKQNFVCSCKTWECSVFAEITNWQFYIVFPIAWYRRLKEYFTPKYESSFHNIAFSNKKSCLDFYSKCTHLWTTKLIQTCSDKQHLHLG